MRHSVSRLLATASLLAFALTAAAATRPHYGGSLRLQMRAAPSSLDPRAADADPRLTSVLFDTLVALDESGKPVPQLARAWQARNNRHWQFTLREDVKLQDGSVLTPAQVAASLKTANPAWQVGVGEGGVTLDFDGPQPHLLAQLACSANAIVVHRSDGALLGTGPYRVAEWQPGRHALLTASDDYWGGRPFLDALQIEMGRNYRDQLMDFDLGKADIIELSADQVRRTMQDGRRVALSSPVELLALRFPEGRAATQDPHLRLAISNTINRASVNNILLQRQGEPAGGLLPQWLSGYSFLFPVTADLAHAKELRPVNSAVVVLAYDAADPLERMLAERIAVNARDAGIIIQTVANPGSVIADAYVARIRLASMDPAAALARMAPPRDPIAVAHILASVSPEALYAAERDLLDDLSIVPLAYLPEVYAVGTHVKNWDEPRFGGWPLPAVWLDTPDAQRNKP